MKPRDLLRCFDSRYILQTLLVVSRRYR